MDFNNVINSGYIKYYLIKVPPVFPGLKCNLHGDQGFVIIYNIMMYKFTQVHVCR